MKFTLFSFSLLLAQFAFAGTLKLVGQGTVEKAPEFVSISVDVEADCFDSAEQAMSSNTQLASQVKSFFESFKKAEKDAVYVNSGWTVKRDKSIYVDGQYTTVCKQKWAVSSSLVLEMADITAWPALQQQLHNLQDQQTTIESGNLTLTIGSPTPRLYPETVTALKIAAQQAAVYDANLQMENLQKYCGFEILELLEITELGVPSHRSLQLESAKAASFAANSPGLEQSFADLSVTQQLSITWKTAGGQTCPAPAQAQQ